MLRPTQKTRNSSQINLYWLAYSIKITNSNSIVTNIAIEFVKYITVLSLVQHMYLLEEFY